MKKLNFSIILLIVFFAIAPTNLKASTEDSKATNTEEVKEAKAELVKLADRVNEINTMNLEALTKDERKELKKELRTIKSEFKEYSKSDNPAVAEAAAEASRGTGIYISGGALLVIIILLILL